MVRWTCVERVVLDGLRTSMEYRSTVDTTDIKGWVDPV